MIASGASARRSRPKTLFGSYWFLNDSTSPDGVQELTVVKNGGGIGKPIQIESITFGWCKGAQALEHILAMLDGRYDQSEFAHEVEPTIETSEQHGHCHHCA